MADPTSDIESIKDPQKRALAVNSRIEEYQAIVGDLSRIRRDALEEMMGSGLTQTQVAERLGMTRSRVSQLLSAGVRPERAFLGAGRLTIAIGAKREAESKKSISEMISAECFTAYEMLSDVARSVGLDASQEVVPPPGVVHLNRPNLIVMTNPRLLPFLAQVMEADPYIRFVHDDQGWHLVDVSTEKEYRSPKDGGEESDFGYIGRLPRPDGKGTFLYLAGTHAQGTLGAAAYIAENLTSLHKDLKTRRFSTIIQCHPDPRNGLRMASIERVTPLYRHDGN